MTLGVGLAGGCDQEAPVKAQASGDVGGISAPGQAADVQAAPGFLGLSPA